MNSRKLPESDWSHFRELRDLALERFCRRVLGELEPLMQDSERTYHQRYIEIFGTLKQRDRELSQAFDDVRRSRMIEQLATMCMLRLVEPTELSAFTADTRTAVETLAQLHDTLAFPRRVDVES